MALIVSVHVGNYVDIGDVRVKVIKAGGAIAQLSIEAPRETPIVRSDAKNKSPRPKQNGD